MSTEKTVNYSDAMVARLHSFVGECGGSFNYEQAQIIAAELDRKPKSIIAKAKREGLTYIPKPAYVPKGRGQVEKKSAIVDAIVDLLAVSDDDAKRRLANLAKADKAALDELREQIRMVNNQTAAFHNAGVVAAKFIEARGLSDDFDTFAGDLANAD